MNIFTVIKIACMQVEDYFLLGLYEAHKFTDVSEERIFYAFKSEEYSNCVKVILIQRETQGSRNRCR
jgi:hypothetical protein